MRTNERDLYPKAHGRHPWASPNPFDTVRVTLSGVAPFSPEGLSEARTQQVFERSKRRLAACRLLRSKTCCVRASDKHPLPDRGWKLPELEWLVQRIDQRLRDGSGIDRRRRCGVRC